MLHFSGYGLGGFAAQADGLNAALHRLRDRNGATPERRMESVAAERAAAKRREAITGRADPHQISSDDFVNYFDGHLDGVVRPRIQASGRRPNSRVAFETVLNVQNTLRAANEAPLPWEPCRTAQTEELMKQLAEACLVFESTRCTRSHVATDIIIAAQGIDAEARRIAADPFSADWRGWRGWRDHAEQPVAQCHQYRLEIDSTRGSTVPGPSGWQFSERMQGVVDLRLSGPVLEFSEPIGLKQFEIVGAGQLASIAYSMSDPDACSGVAGVVQAPSLFKISRLAFARNGEGGLVDFNLEYFPSQNASSHQFVDGCGHPPTQTPAPLFAWLNTFFVSVGSDNCHFNDQIGFFVDDWIVDTAPVLGGEKVLGRNTVASFQSEVGVNYDTTMQLRLVHTPVMP